MTRPYGLGNHGLDQWAGTLLVRPNGLVYIMPIIGLPFVHLGQSCTWTPPACQQPDLCTRSHDRVKRWLWFIHVAYCHVSLGRCGFTETWVASLLATLYMDFLLSRYFLPVSFTWIAFFSIWFRLSLGGHVSKKDSICISCIVELLVLFDLCIHCGVKNRCLRMFYITEFAKWLMFFLSEITNCDLCPIEAQVP